MQQFLWIIDGRLFPHIKADGGVSPSYVVPRAQSSGNMDRLAGSSLWIVLRLSAGDMLFAYVHVTRVEQFEDGFNDGDYLLFINQAKSYRVISDIAAPDNRLLTQTHAFGLGVSEIAAGTMDDVHFNVLKTVATNFRRPPDAILDRIPAPPISGLPETVAQRYMAAVSSRFSLQDVWAMRTPIVLAPFAHFAYLKIAQVYGQDKADTLSAHLDAFDPTANRTATVAQQDVAEANYQRSVLSRPVVDVDLLPIDTTKLYARRFISKETSSINLDEIMEKIEHAEKRHQDMLRDIASYLASLGMVPMQSSSIDLSVEIQNGLFIFELKSAHSTNILSQSAKGSFQLLCYRSALVEDGRSISKTVLVLEKTSSEELDEYVEKILRNIGLVVLFYDSQAIWPNRLAGLDKVLSGN